MVDIPDIPRLLEQAGELRAQLASPWQLTGPEHAAEIAGKFLASEDQVALWHPDAGQRLTELMTGWSAGEGADRHMYMASRVLARSGLAGSAITLINTCRDPRPQVALMARLNIASLVRTEENRKALHTALKDSLVQAHDDLRVVLANALAAQRSAESDELLLHFLSIERSGEAARSLVTMICGRVDDAPRLLEQVIPGDDPVGVTRLGLEAIVGTSGVEDLIAAAGSPSHCVRTTAVRWLGRCPHPLTVGPLLKGLADPNPETRLDVVNCLALFGSRESLLGVVSALHDPDRLVAGAAMHHIAQIMAEELDGLDLRYDEGDALDSDSADRLAPLAGHRVRALRAARTFRGAPLEPRTDVDLLYMGYLPRIVWMHLTASYQPGVPFDPNQDLVGNLESIHELELWLHERQDETAGRWTFHGEFL